MNWEQLSKDLRYYFSREFNFPLIPPINVTLNLTYRCNQKCIMCSIRKDNIDPCVELTLQEIKDIINQVADWGIPEIVFTGGEPLILKDIFPIIEYTASKNIRATLITNCFCSKEVLEKLKDLPLSHMQVSVDGADSETHDFIRQAKGSFNITVDNLKELLSAPKRKYSINATTTILNQNVDQLLEIAMLMKEVGVEKLSIRPVHADNSDPTSLINKDCTFWIPKERLHVLDDQINKLIKYDNETGFIDCRPGFEYIKEYFRNGYIRPTNSCYNGYNRLVIAYNERNTYEVWMCGGMLGDIRRDRLHKIWMSQNAKRVRKKMNQCSKSCAFPCCYEAGLESVFSIIQKNKR